MPRHPLEPKLVPLAWAKLHYEHLHQGIPIRRLAARDALIPSTVMRRIRQAESLADVDVGTYYDPGLLYRDICLHYDNYANPLAASDEAT